MSICGRGNNKFHSESTRKKRVALVRSGWSRHGHSAPQSTYQDSRTHVDYRWTATSTLTAGSVSRNGLLFRLKNNYTTRSSSPPLSHPVRYAVMPCVAQGGNDVGVSLPPGYLCFERGSPCSRAGVCVARYTLPPAALHPRRGGKTGCDLICHHNHGRKSVREAPVRER